jgi:hypothetical protein
MSCLVVQEDICLGARKIWHFSLDTWASDKFAELQAEVLVTMLCTS